MRKVLFFVEGFTDIRFVTGLSQICNLTLCVPVGRRREWSANSSTLWGVR